MLILEPIESKMCGYLASALNVEKNVEEQYHLFWKKTLHLW